MILNIRNSSLLFKTQDEDQMIMINFDQEYPIVNVVWKVNKALEITLTWNESVTIEFSS